jgi:hypothetical protein
MKKHVLIIGFDPTLLDFSSPELKPMNLTAEKVLAGLEAERNRLEADGYSPVECLVDLGETAENRVRERLQEQNYGCVVIGAGIRLNPKFFLLFEKLVNIVHELAPKSKISFNTNPTDTTAAVKRWI